MNRILIFLLSALLLFSGCSKLRRMKLFGGKKSDYGQVQPSDIEKLRNAYRDGRIQALEELIAIYQDSNQPLDIRLAAGRALAETQHPTALNALAEVVAEADALDMTFMIASIELLAEFRDNPKAPEAMVQSMHRIEEKSNELHMVLVRNLNKVRTKDQILTLLDLYGVSKANLSRTEKLLAETLGAIGDDETIPVLMMIAKDPDINIGVRNRAIEILGKKEATEVVGAFTEMLGDPATNREVRDFAINTMAGVKEENLILSLLDTYNTGKKEYFSLLNTLLDALGDFNEPEVIKTVIEIAKSENFPRLLRLKAIQKLGEYGDPTVIDSILPLLDDAENYELYPALLEMVDNLRKSKVYKEEIRRRTFSAHRKFKP